MTNDDNNEVEPVKIAFEYEDNGNFRMKIGPDWERVVREYYTNFEAIKKTLITDPEHVVGRFEEVQEKEENEPGCFVMEDPPEKLLENPEWQKRIFNSIYNLLAYQGMGFILIDEIDGIERLLENGNTKSAIVRQNAFFEEYLTILCQIRFQLVRGRTLSNKEFGLIEQMGHSDRTRLAHILQSIDEEEHGYLQELISSRNQIVHNSWSGFTDEQEDHFESVASKIDELMEDFLSEAKERGKEPPVVNID